MKVHLLARHARVLHSASDRRQGTMLLSNADLVIRDVIATSTGDLRQAIRLRPRDQEAWGKQEARPLRRRVMQRDLKACVQRGAFTERQASSGRTAPQKDSLFLGAPGQGRHG